MAGAEPRRESTGSPSGSARSTRKAQQRIRQHLQQCVEREETGRLNTVAERDVLTLGLIESWRRLRRECARQRGLMLRRQNFLDLALPVLCAAVEARENQARRRVARELLALSACTATWGSSRAALAAEEAEAWYDITDDFDAVSFFAGTGTLVGSLGTVSWKRLTLVEQMAAGVAAVQSSAAPPAPGRIDPRAAARQHLEAAELCARCTVGDAQRQRRQLLYNWASLEAVQVRSGSRLGRRLARRLSAACMAAEGQLLRHQQRVRRHAPGAGGSPRSLRSLSPSLSPSPRRRRRPPVGPRPHRQRPWHLHSVERAELSIARAVAARSPELTPLRPRPSSAAAAPGGAGRRNALRWPQSTPVRPLSAQLPSRGAAGPPVAAAPQGRCGSAVPSARSSWLDCDPDSPGEHPAAAESAAESLSWMTTLRGGGWKLAGQIDYLAKVRLRRVAADVPFGPQYYCKRPEVPKRCVRRRVPSVDGASSAQHPPSPRAGSGRIR
eukprot:TRINITY_DN7788_c0_g1_i1.p1 TRINITY_DN7788_c0_g1~~TRINITY_DN7788_c0_g1_i1.p1  ORF type:complete len:516 (+),score=131.50 TRINITY_DN7788_c0_g1_i1:60-1550(+)